MRISLCSRGRRIVRLLKEMEGRIMAAIDNLEGAVVQNTAAVDKASAKIDELAAGGDSTRVQAAADQVAADAARLDAKAS